MGVYEEGALNRLTAAVLAQAVSTEAARLERMGIDDEEMAWENVEQRFDRALEMVLNPEGDDAE